MPKLATCLALFLLIASGSASIAKHRKDAPAPAPGWQYLTPEAAHMKATQQNWPNVPLCDDGGYRIRPCYLSPGRR